MSNKQSLSNNSDPSDSEVYEVEKIVNQRLINGKKQFKVIWAGYSFEEATWEPEENLKCPQKINEFLRRYQDVIRRKNLMSKNSNDPNSQSLQKPKTNQPPNVQSQKSNLLVQKSLVGPSSQLNKEKLQSSLQKSAVINEKKIPDIQNLKSKIMSPSTSNVQVTPDKKTIQNTQQYKKPHSNDQKSLKNQSEISPVSQYKPLPSRQPATSQTTKTFEPPYQPEKSQVTKVIKIQNRSDTFSNNKAQSKVESKIESEVFQNGSSQIASVEPNAQSKKIIQEYLHLDDRFRVNEIIQERKISSQSSESDFRQEESESKNKLSPIFLSVKERLDIQKIIGAISFDKQVQQTMPKTETFSLESPQFFLIKNKFSQEQQIVEKERIIVEQPLQLINFYESLLSE